MAAKNTKRLPENKIAFILWGSGFPLYLFLDSGQINFLRSISFLLDFCPLAFPPAQKKDAAAIPHAAFYHNTNSFIILDTVFQTDSNKDSGM